MWAPKGGYGTRQRGTLSGRRVALGVLTGATNVVTHRALTCESNGYGAGRDRERARRVSHWRRRALKIGDTTVSTHK